MNWGEIKTLQWAIVLSCILSVRIWAKFIYRSVYICHHHHDTLLISRELHTCNSKCFFLTLHLAVSIEDSASLSTNLTLTSGEAFVSNCKMGGGRWGRGQETHDTTMITLTQMQTVKQSSTFYFLGCNYCCTHSETVQKNYTHRNATTLQRNMEGRNEWGGKKEKVSTGFNSNSHFYKSIKRMASRRPNALQREKREREEKVKNTL